MKQKQKKQHEKSWFDFVRGIWMTVYIYTFTYVYYCFMQVINAARS